MKTSTVTVAHGFGCVLDHGAILDFGNKRVKVHHPMWRRVLHTLTFRMFPLHSETVITVVDL